MKIEHKIEIDAPLPVVWSVFSCVEDWEKWNVVCRSGCFVGDRAAGGRTGCGEKKHIAQGDCVSFVIRPLIFPVRISPRVLRCDPGKEIVWEGKRFGIRAEHTFRFEESNGRVVLESIETFYGPVALLSRFLLIPARLHRLTRELLFAIKTEAEKIHLVNR